jgi:hypothetical protein
MIEHRGGRCAARMGQEARPLSWPPQEMPTDRGTMTVGPQVLSEP